MHSVRLPTRRQPVLFAVLLCWAIAAASPALAVDLFARHRVTVQFATAEGKPMGDAEVRVFAPGDLGRPVLTGRTEADGTFAFGADRDGLWSAEARNGAEVARATVRVGSAASEPREPPSPIWLIGGLVLLLALAMSFRILRRRTRRR